MKIDGNELAIMQNELDQQGFHEEALKIKMEFLRQVRESGDHCPCKEKCPHHGNCFESATSPKARSTPTRRASRPSARRPKHRAAPAAATAAAAASKICDRLL